MLVAVGLLAALVVAYWCTGAKGRSLDRDDIQRVRRLSERLGREATYPFD